MATSTQEFSIEMVSVPKDYLKDVLRALLHSIFFHWLLINVTPLELHVLDTTISITDSPEIKEMIEEKVSEFYQSIENNVKQGKISVLFYEKKQKKNWFQFSKSEELACWEQWTLAIGVAFPENEHEQHRLHLACERQLSQCLLAILKLANDHKEHIPSITFQNIPHLMTKEKYQSTTKENNDNNDKNEYEGYVDIVIGNNDNSNYKRWIA
ncbi:unnamed protein product [Cunninghamella blakesleeana]